MRTRRAAFFCISSACSALLLFGTGCDRPPSASQTKEWTPADHDQPGENDPQNAARTPKPKSSEDATRTVGEVMWEQHCIACHGTIGKGDGPSAAMFNPPDLTREDWQSRVTDGQIAETIRTGRGKMPKFDLPDEAVSALVRRIRLARGR